MVVVVVTCSRSMTHCIFRLPELCLFSQEGSKWEVSAYITTSCMWWHHMYPSSTAMHDMSSVVCQVGARSSTTTKINAVYVNSSISSSTMVTGTARTWLCKFGDAFGSLLQATNDVNMAPTLSCCVSSAGPGVCTGELLTPCSCVLLYLSEG